ncbi:hypothetical protein [Methylomonas rosea]|uniref:Uncharacterized protein n=1 Tax=Methylomonas rosea TaxID=2952227 RepID=A0ABT1TQF6_9GAMM|nr:hypothetical protein [Methylomonas sp. WSC-7]MCQ8116997.1 hypothetical protein [Methylomonas sp. WSC-7]
MEAFIAFLYEHFVSIIGVLLTTSLVAYLTWRNNFKVRRANACVAFRAAVLSELGSIYPNPAEWPKNIDAFLRSHFTALQIAVENFRPFVPWWKRWLFSRAWFHYRCSTGRPVDIQCYQHYVDFGDNPNHKAIFYANVSRLLAFANET